MIVTVNTVTNNSLYNSSQDLINNNTNDIISPPPFHMLPLFQVGYFMNVIVRLQRPVPHRIKPRWNMETRHCRDRKKLGIYKSSYHCEEQYGTMHVHTSTQAKWLALRESPKKRKEHSKCKCYVLSTNFSKCGLSDKVKCYPKSDLRMQLAIFLSSECAVQGGKAHKKTKQKQKIHTVFLKCRNKENPPPDEWDLLKGTSSFTC